jgi:hypothetical protein
MVEAVNDPADPEELAEEEGGSGIPMTASEIVAEDGDDVANEDADDADDADDAEPDDGEIDEDATDEASA